MPAETVSFAFGDFLDVVAVSIFSGFVRGMFSAAEFFFAYILSSYILDVAIKEPM